MKQPEIRDLGVVGDQRTCALIDKEGTICWYCPERFDKQAVFAFLLDTQQGGYWKIEVSEYTFLKRFYEGNTGVLHSQFIMKNGEIFSITDWMPINFHVSGICRKFSRTQTGVRNILTLRPDYGLRDPVIRQINATTLLYEDINLYLRASHEIIISDQRVIFSIPEHEEGWACLSNDSIFDINKLDDSLSHTLKSWSKLSSALNYEGIFAEQVNNSLRAMHLLTSQKSGGIIAAATTSLPEVIGGERNYDYRFVWLRDTAMIVSALTRADSNGNEASRFLDFLCSAKNSNKNDRFSPLYDLNKNIAPAEQLLPLEGYKRSQPVRIGNNANDQIQLDANGNVLLAAKLIYNKSNKKEHWETVSYIADYLAENWKEPDHGIWEEHVKKQFTSSKIIVAKSLEFISDFAESTAQKDHWRDAANNIRKFVSDNCLTRTGAFAVYAGSNAVDITAALYPVWLYTEPDSKEMLETIKELEAFYCEGILYRRHLELFNSKNEGIFLAGCLWMAQYYIMLKDKTKALEIINAVLKFSNDLGFFAEEGDIKTGEMLGNFPQAFVHASFIGAVIDLKALK